MSYPSEYGATGSAFTVWRRRVTTTIQWIGPADILVLQKADGRVRRVISGALQSGEVLDIAVHSSSERGLLGIALHPDFPTALFVYLYYTESSTGGDTSGSSIPRANRVYRYTWNGSALINPQLILDLPATSANNDADEFIVIEHSR